MQAGSRVRESAWVQHLAASNQVGSAAACDSITPYRLCKIPAGKPHLSLHCGTLLESWALCDKQWIGQWIG